MRTGISIIVTAIMLMPCAPISAQTVGDFWGETAALTASNGTSGDGLGQTRTASVFGDLALVGAPQHEVPGLGTGSAYVFQRQRDGSWLQTASLFAPDGAESDSFGNSTGLSGSIAVIGSRLDDDNGDASGSVYVFERQEDGVWVQTDKITAGTDGAAGDNFGQDVCISGTRLLVGAHGDDDTAQDTGSAYLFERQADASWIMVTKLTASDPEAYDEFGVSVTLDGDTALIGAYKEDDNGPGAGAAYVFERQDGGDWLQVAKLIAADGASADYFGVSVSLSNDTALVGAHYADLSVGLEGTAYIFERQSDGTWPQAAKLTASDASNGDFFGLDTGLSGDTALVGAYGSGPAGAAYTFTRQENGDWVQTARLTPSDGAPGDYFGSSAGLSGTTAVVGATSADDYAGRAYIFELHSVLNLETGMLDNDILEAVHAADAGDRLAVRSNAFDFPGILNQAGKPLEFIAVEPCGLSGEAMWLAADGTVLTQSSDVGVLEYPFSFKGQFVAPIDGLLATEAVLLADPGRFLQGGATVLCNTVFDTLGGTAYLDGVILADRVRTAGGGMNRVTNSTDVHADYLNDGATIVHRGTLSIFGELSGTGLLLGEVDTGPGLQGGASPEPGDGISIGGPYVTEPDASLRMLDFDWTLGVGGDFDCGIDQSDRYRMWGATLSLTGLHAGTQTMELMSIDIGADEAALDPTLPGHFPIGTMHVKSGTTATLVDLRDNVGDGFTQCEALYAGAIVVDAGGVLVIDGCPVYAASTNIEGTVLGEIIDLPGTVPCLGDLDGSGAVDVEDLLDVLEEWGCSGSCTADVNEDGIVDISDLLTVIANWGTCG